jgi:hypothetical protein
MNSLLTRLSAIAIAFVLVFLLYQRLPFRYFSIDFFAQLNASLFNKIKMVDQVDQRFVILNAGTKSSEEIKDYIKFLLINHPKRIGVNLCHFDKAYTKSLLYEYQSNELVVFSDCSQDNLGLARIINPDNSVTHFRNDDPNSFERKILSDPSIPLTKKERINYSPGIRFNEAELDSTKFLNSIISNSIVLIGYLGDYIVESDFNYPHELKYYTNDRITPVNINYAYEDASPDMYDTEISAQIISSLMDQNWIRDVPKSFSVIILLFFMMLQSLVMYLMQNKRILISIAITILSYFLIKLAGSYLIVLLFTKGYYLELDELMMLLLFVTIINLGFNLFRNKKLSASPPS